MKKNTLFLLVLLVFAISCGVVFADGAETETTAVVCTFAEPAIENEGNKAILGEVTADDWSIGPEDAALTLVEYADFQCPYCSNAGLLAIQFQASHPDDVRYVYRHFPLSFHEKAPMSAYAADAAGKQGFFFNAEEFLYSTQNDWTGLETLDIFDAWLREHITEGIPELDYDQWVADYESEEIRAAVDASYDKVVATNLIAGTPSFFANFYDANMDPAMLEKYIEVFKLQKNYKTECPALSVEAGKGYTATLHTTAGDVVMDLFADAAPNLVSNFIALAKDGWYDGNAFHNVIPGFIAQAGDPTGTGVGLAGYYIADENLNSGGFNEPGAVAMANTGADMNSAQFFIAMDLDAYFRKAVSALGEELAEEELDAKVASKIDALNARYSVFGRVAEASMEILPLIDASTVINSVDIEVHE